MLTILLLVFIATIYSQEQPQNRRMSGNSPDLVPLEQRLTMFRRLLPIRLRNMNRERDPIKLASGYSGYRSGYGFFRGRRSGSTETARNSA